MHPYAGFAPRLPASTTRIHPCDRRVGGRDAIEDAEVGPIVAEVAVQAM